MAAPETRTPEDVAQERVRFDAWVKTLGRESAAGQRAWYWVAYDEMAVRSRTRFGMDQAEFRAAYPRPAEPEAYAGNPRYDAARLRAAFFDGWFKNMAETSDEERAHFEATYELAAANRVALFAMDEAEFRATYPRPAWFAAPAPGALAPPTDDRARELSAFFDAWVLATRTEAAPGLRAFFWVAYDALATESQARFGIHEAGFRSAYPRPAEPAGWAANKNYDAIRARAAFYDARAARGNDEARFLAAHERAAANSLAWFGMGEAEFRAAYPTGAVVGVRREVSRVEVRAALARLRANTARDLAALLALVGPSTRSDPVLEACRRTAIVLCGPLPASARAVGPAAEEVDELMRAVCDTLAPEDLAGLAPRDLFVVVRALHRGTREPRHADLAAPLLELLLAHEHSPVVWSGALDWLGLAVDRIPDASLLARALARVLERHPHDAPCVRHALRAALLGFGLGGVAPPEKAFGLERWIVPVLANHAGDAGVLRNAVLALRSLYREPGAARAAIRAGAVVRLMRLVQRSSEAVSDLSFRAVCALARFMTPSNVRVFMDCGVFDVAISIVRAVCACEDRPTPAMEVLVVDCLGVLVHYGRGYNVRDLSAGLLSVLDRLVRRGLSNANVPKGVLAVLREVAAHPATRLEDLRHGVAIVILVLQTSADAEPAHARWIADVLERAVLRMPREHGESALDVILQLHGKFPNDAHLAHSVLVLFAHTVLVPTPLICRLVVGTIQKFHADVSVVGPAALYVDRAISSDRAYASLFANGGLLAVLYNVYATGEEAPAKSPEAGLSSSAVRLARRLLAALGRRLAPADLPFGDDGTRTRRAEIRRAYDRFAAAVRG